MWEERCFKGGKGEEEIVCQGYLDEGKRAKLKEGGIFMNLEKLSKSFLCLLVIALLIPCMAWAAAGKVRGTVMDKETGEPLIQANVRIQGTSMGAASDVNGEYIILNVPAGKYALEVSYMGYKKTTITNVIVNAGLTTYRDFELEKVVLEGQEVTIVAERPLIDKGETNEIHYMRSEDIEQMPIRGVDAIVGTMAGVIVDEQDGELHVRGGRDDEMAYFVDGVNVSNNFEGERMISIISNAIEEVQLQTGGFTAEFGGKMSGMTLTTLKTGKPKYNFTGEFISDDFWALKDDAGSYEILGINELYSFGYNDYILTASGPILPEFRDLRFFVAAQSYNRLSNASWFQGFQQDEIQLINKTTDWHNVQHVDTLNYSMDMPPGRQPGGGNAGLTVQGNLLFDLRPFRIKVGGTWHNSRSTGQTTDPENLLNIGTRSRRNHNQNYNAYLNLTHTVDPTMFYTISASYSNRNWENGDPLMGWDKDSWKDWGDPAINPTLVDSSDTWGNYPLPFDPNFRVFYPGSPVWDYNKGEETKLSLKFDFTKQMGKAHELKVGGEYSQSKFRSFNFDCVEWLRRDRDVAKNPELYSEYDYYSPLAGYFMGYDYLGNEVEEDMIVETKIGLAAPENLNLRNAPPKPIYGGFYLQDRIEMKDLIINAGLRFDYINNGHASIDDLAAMNQDLAGGISEENWLEAREYSYVSPRLGFSFPVTDKAVFHAQFGKFIQAPNLQQTWTHRDYGGFLEFLYGGVYFAPIHNPNLKPERTTSYEFGFQMQFGSNASLDVTAFYKDTRDLTTYRVILPTVPDYRAPCMMMNGDFGTVKGFTATFNLRRTARFQANINYTYSNAEGTGSAVGEHFAIAWQESDPHFPRVIAPLAYDQRHKGTVVIDARSEPTDGPEFLGGHPLGNIGLNLMFDFHSGSPYTRIPIGDNYSEVYGYNAPPPLEAPNSSNLPWFYQLNAKLDKTFNIGPVRLNVYLWAINVLGLQSIIDGWRQTGRPDTDGWLETDAGRAKIDDMGEDAADYIKWYNAEISNCGSWGWQTPRQIRFGLKFEI